MMIAITFFSFSCMYIKPPQVDSSRLLSDIPGGHEVDMQFFRGVGLGSIISSYFLFKGEIAVQINLIPVNSRFYINLRRRNFIARNQ